MSNWEEFEKLVFHIQKCLCPEAKVTFDETINGRQFDVTLRFSIGPHNYLTVIECKKHKRPVSVDKIDGLITKARDANANKAILVSSSGFQGGAFSVAQRHGIDLFSLKEILDDPEELAKAIEIPVLHHSSLAFITQNGQIPFPDRDNEIRYWVEKTILKFDKTRTTLRNYLVSKRPTYEREATSNRQTMRLDFPKGTFASLLNFFENKPVCGIHFDFEIRKGFLVPNLKTDPWLLREMNSGFQLRDELSGEVTSVLKKDVLQEPRKVEVGHFYKCDILGFNFYISGKEGDLVNIFLIESYQHGSLFQAKFKQHEKHIKTLTQITDCDEIARLKKILIKMENNGV